MPKAICRCGQTLTVPADGSERIVCPNCRARVRIRTSAARPAGPGDGFIRFQCPCGRRLKVEAGQPPSHGKCPDCGRVVAIPAASTVASSPETPTEDLAPDDLAALERWSRQHQERAASGASDTELYVPSAPTVNRKVEAGARVCPQCGKLVHLAATVCRACGAAVPKR